jgi:hypothetical protein
MSQSAAAFRTKIQTKIHHAQRPTAPRRTKIHHAQRPTAPRRTKIHHAQRPTAPRRTKIHHAQQAIDKPPRRILVFANRVAHFLANISFLTGYRTQFLPLRRAGPLAADVTFSTSPSSRAAGRRRDEICEAEASCAVRPVQTFLPLLSLSAGWLACRRRIGYILHPRRTIALPPTGRLLCSDFYMLLHASAASASTASAAASSAPPVGPRAADGSATVPSRDDFFYPVVRHARRRRFGYIPP